MNDLFGGFFDDAEPVAVAENVLAEPFRVTPLRFASVGVDLEDVAKVALRDDQRRRDGNVVRTKRSLHSANKQAAIIIGLLSGIRNHDTFEAEGFATAFASATPMLDQDAQAVEISYDGSGTRPDTVRLGGGVGNSNVFVLGMTTGYQAVEGDYLGRDFGDSLAVPAGERDSAVVEGKNKPGELVANRVKNGRGDFARTSPVVRVSHIASLTVLGQLLGGWRVGNRGKWGQRLDPVSAFKSLNCGPRDSMPSIL